MPQTYRPIIYKCKTHDIDLTDEVLAKALEQSETTNYLRYAQAFAIQAPNVARGLLAVRVVPHPFRVDVECPGTDTSGKDAHTLIFTGTYLA